MTIVKLTSATTGPELAKGQSIHINFHRVQGMWRVQGGAHDGMTLIEMNVMKGERPLTYYVLEEPKDIYALLDED